MMARHTTKGMRRYPYYICPRSGRTGEQRCNTPSIPRRKIEQAVVERLRAFGRRGGVAHDVEPGRIEPARAACVLLDARWDRLAPEDRATVLRETVRHAAYDAATSTLQIFLAGDPGPTLQTPLAVRSKKTSGSGTDQPTPDDAQGTIPRVARLMALALHFDGLLAKGVVKDHAEIARLGHVTRARITQILNLLHLAPDIQERLLFLPCVTRGRAPITEHALRAVAAEPLWETQRTLFGSLWASA